MIYQADQRRYEHMQYQRCGNSGLQLPRIALGLWHNFGGVDVYEHATTILRSAFDHGITHFDLANNYGPPPGSAEDTFGRMLAGEFRAYRDEILISTKAGFHMWPGPYGDWGSRKYLIASLDQSLRRMGLDYVDIFYHHRPDPETPIDETMQALDHIVRSGKALYVGISNYGPEETLHATRILRDLGTPCLIHQHSYSMLNRGAEDGLLDVLTEQQIGGIAFCPLAQGLLTDKYLSGIPEHSRASKSHSFLQRDRITDEVLDKVGQLNDIAAEREQSLAQMALAWVLRHPIMCTALIGASRAQQVEDCVACLEHLEFNQDTLDRIDAVLAQ